MHTDAGYTKQYPYHHYLQLRSASHNIQYISNWQVGCVEQGMFSLSFLILFTKQQGHINRLMVHLPTMPFQSAVRGHFVYVLVWPVIKAH